MKAVNLILAVFLSLVSFTAIAAAKPELETPLREYTQYATFLANSVEDSFIILNRASQQLILVKDREIVLEMKVVVGRTKFNTPLGRTEITHIITNPYWNIPNWIVRDELMVKWKDPLVLKKYKDRGFEILQGKEVIGLEKVFELKGSFRVRQRPGSQNALGKVKFRLKNAGGVYLHDTNQKELFAKSNRKFSHGCVRLEKPLKLLDMISDVTYAEKSGERWFKLSNPVPVYSVNWKTKEEVNETKK